MKLLFLTMTKLDSLQGRGIYIDLLNLFKEKGHEIFVVSPSERRLKTKTVLRKENGVSILNVKTLNLQKSTILEKGVGQLLLEYQYLKGIKKYFAKEKFDLIIYSTPPITFSKAIRYIKNRDGAYSYLLLKDIFPQNAIDMKMMKKGGLLHRYFEKKEKTLYNISDTIGCMSEANKSFILEHNPEIFAEKLEVNPNTIKPLFIDYNAKEKEAVKNKYRIPLNKKIFVYGGNLGIPQGVDFLIETISNLKEPIAHILVVGSGTQFKKLESWFNLYKPSNATLLSGLPKDDYDKLLGACDVGMIFLHKDFTIPNFPSRLLSYLEMKMPVLAATDKNTDIGTVIQQAKCGYWVEAGDNLGMQEKISKLCNDNLALLGENSWQLLQSDYLVERSYNLIVDKINV